MIKETKDMTREEMLKEIESLKKQMATLPRKLSTKKTEKGGLSVYGLQRFPVTLYKEQWLKLANLMATDSFKADVSSLPERTEPNATIRA